jgi:hypothetical protein
MSIGDVATAIWAAIAAAITSVIEPALLSKAPNFAIVAGLLSALIVVFDWLVVLARGKGILGVTHGWWRTPLLAVVWFLGGFMAGGGGILLRMYEATLQAAFLAALTWQTFLTQARSVVQRQQEDTQK